MKRLLAGTGIVIGFLLGFGLVSRGDGPIGFSLIVQNGGTPQGAAVTLNCDGTTTTCSTSKGVVTVSSSGGGGSADPCSQAVSMLPSGLHCNTVTLHQADFIALANTPFILVPSPGAGNVIFPFAFRYRYIPGPGPYPYSEPGDGGPESFWGNNMNQYSAHYWGAYQPTSGNAFAIFGSSDAVNTDAANFFAGFAVQTLNHVDPVNYTNVPLVLQTDMGDTMNRGPILTLTINAAGTGYTVGDTEIITGMYGINDAQLTVSTVNGSGGVTGLTLVAAGQTTEAGTNLATANIGNVTSATVTAGHAGLLYANGDTGSISGCGNGDAGYIVVSSTGGAVNTVSINGSGGTAYTPMMGCTTTVINGSGDGSLELDTLGGGGSGLTVDDTVQVGDGTLTITMWYTVAAE